MRVPSRRHVLRGAGVALTLPFLESLAPRRARGQVVEPRRRFVAFYFPLGIVTPGYWMPTTTGTGSAWSLSPLLAPLAPVKNRVTVLGQVDQTAYGPNGIDGPRNGPLTAAYLTAVRCTSSVSGGVVVGRAGISIDQRIAQLPNMAAPAASLQLGLATHQSSCEGSCDLSRSISWRDATTPLFKLINLQDVFDKIVAGPASPALPTARVKARKSVLDFVLGHAQGIQPRLGSSDRARFDQFLTSVRDVEQRIAASALSLACVFPSRPALSADVNMVPPGYNRDDHANVMIDLVALALTCDATRVVSFMLDDARSDFVYDFLNLRNFTPTGSTATAGPATPGTPLGCANAPWPSDSWATIVWWYVSKLARLCQALDMAPEDNGATVLDNTVAWFGSGMVREYDWRNVPVIYVGSGGGQLKVDQFVPFQSTQSLSNIYLTFLGHVFGAGANIPDTSFGDSSGIVPDILA